VCSRQSHQCAASATKVLVELLEYLHSSTDGIKAVTPMHLSRCVGGILLPARKTPTFRTANP